MNGIYVIKNTKENKLYIGSSMYPDYRIHAHFKQLNENTHANKELQNDYNRLGKINFSFEIIIDDLEYPELKSKEREYIDSLNSINESYNQNKTKGCRLYKKKNSENFKNIKIDFDLHHKIKEISLKTGISVGKLVNMGAIKIIEEFKNGEFDKLITVQKKIRRDGTIIR